MTLPVALLVKLAAGALVLHTLTSSSSGGQRIARFIWQGGQPWGKAVLGTSTGFTIAGAGCLLTSLTMALNALLGEDLNPDDVQAGLLGVGGCFRGPELYLELAASNLGLSAPESERLHPLKGASVAELRARIDQTLRRGGLAIAHVGASAAGAGFHFILVHAVAGDTYLCADPATGKDVPLQRSTLSGVVMWGSTPRQYNIVGVAPIYRG